MFASMDSAQVWTVVGVLAAMAGFVVAASQRGQSRLESRFDAFDAKLEARFQGVETRIQGVENKIGDLDQRLESRIQGVETRIQGVDTQLVGLRGDVGRIEGKLDEHLAAHART